MKKIAITLALLGLFTNAALADAPEPTLAEQAKAYVEAGQEAGLKGDPYVAYYNAPEAVSLADAIYATVSAEESTSFERLMTLRVAAHHYRGTNDELAQAMYEWGNHRWHLAKDYWTAQQVRDNTFGVLGHAHAVSRAASRTGDVTLLEDYYQSIVGKGDILAMYQRWFKSQLNAASIEDAKAMLTTEIRGLLTRPQSDARDKWLVELRGQLKVLSELQ